MATLKLVKASETKASYAAEGNSGRVRVPLKMFAGGQFPETFDVSFDVAQSVGGGSSKVPVPAEVAEAARLLKEFREKQKADREARLTPEQRERRDEKARAKAAEREQKKAAKAAKSKKAKK